MTNNHTGHNLSKFVFDSPNEYFYIMSHNGTCDLWKTIHFFKPCDQTTNITKLVLKNTQPFVTPYTNTYIILYIDGMILASIIGG